MVKLTEVSTAKLAERIQAFCRARKLTHEQFADAIGTPASTVRSWLHKGITPPGAAVVLMDLIEQDSRVRTRLALNHGGSRSRGRPFTAPNEFSFGSPTREAALAEAQQRKQKRKNEMKKKTQDTVIDPNERVVKPRNSSKSFKDGGGTMRHAERSLAEHAMDVEGGGKVKDRR
jgi:transcriptional regulator with XRE-family HTH domain